VLATPVPTGLAAVPWELKRYTADPKRIEQGEAEQFAPTVIVPPLRATIGN